MVLCLLGPAVPAAGQSSASSPPPCDSPQHRQFDFWIGEWEVRTPDGKVAGRNVVTLDLERCVVHEHWTGASGMRGESFNMWDRDRNVWHQTWVNSRGQLLVLEGAFEEGAMRLVGDSGPVTKRVRNRITWTASGDGVRQVWEMSTDAGKSWQVAFDGRYRRVQ